VFKNTLVKRAMDEVGGYEAFYPFLVQQNAFIFAKDELGRPAQILKDFLKTHKQPAFRRAIVDGAVYNDDQLDALASMKSKQEVIGDIIGLLLSPINNIVGGLQSQGSNIVGALKTLAEKEN
jgi:large subunit ribosomal protein L10